MPRYYYDGPVMEFDFCVHERWKATTIAPTEAKARCNLAYRFKMEHGMKPATKVNVPGKLIVINENNSFKNHGKYHQISMDEVCEDLYGEGL